MYHRLIYASLKKHEYQEIKTRLGGFSFYRNSERGNKHLLEAPGIAFSVDLSNPGVDGYPQQQILLEANDAVQPSRYFASHQRFSAHDFESHH